MKYNSKKIKLSDIAYFNPKRELKKGSYAKFIDMASIPVNLREISGGTYKTFNGSSSKFKNGDVLFSRITPCLENGKTSKVNILNENEIAHGSTEFIVISAKEPKYDENYLYYLTRLPRFREFSKSRMIGTSGRQRVAWQSLAEYEFYCPGKIYRNKAGKILSTFDDKIQSNSLINQTLESIAQTIFKSWFIDFDPVYAKVQAIREGRDPELAAMAMIAGKSAAAIKKLQGGNCELANELLGLENLRNIASLFPSEFIESAIGLIPKGWNTAAVYDLGTYINGAAYKAFEPNAEQRGLPIIKIAELKSGVTIQTRYSTLNMPEKYKINLGDILFSWSGNPDTSIDIFVWACGTAWLNQHIFRVVPHEKQERSFVLMTLKCLKPVFAEIARDKQTTGLGHVTIADLKRLNLAVPTKSVLNQCDKIITPLIDKILVTKCENQTLANLRDVLLPHLISGELSIKNTDPISNNNPAYAKAMEG